MIRCIASHGQLAAKAHGRRKPALVLSRNAQRRLVSSDAKSWSATLHLPKTEFPLRANAVVREPELLPSVSTELYKQQRIRPSTESFVLHDGPPFANGALHMGHALNKVVKDIANRYQLLQGRVIRYIPGWDCHGLPIEVKALEATQADGKSHGSRMAEQNTNDETDREMVFRTTGQEVRSIARRFASSAIQMQKEEMKRWGLLADWDTTYTTMDPDFEARQLDVFQGLVKEGMIHRGLKPVHWSPSSRTALAEAELVYVDNHVSQSVVVGFPLVTLSNDLDAALRAFGVDTSHTALELAIWTTTPWTLPANMAIAFNESLVYNVCEVVVGESAPRLLLVAEERLEYVKSIVDGPVTQLVSVHGSSLSGCTAAHPLFRRDVPCLAGSHVTVDAGTGLVHTAPGHGAEDFQLCNSHGIQAFSPVDDEGRFTTDSDCHEPRSAVVESALKGVDGLRGKEVLADGNRAVIEVLRASGSLLHHSKYVHRYPYDWRTNKPIIFRSTSQWFANLQRAKPLAENALDDVRMIPAVGRTRLQAMLSSRLEWCISRQRHWGVPIPVFYDKETGEPLLDEECIAYVRDLVRKHPQGTDVWWELETKDLLPPSRKADADRWERGRDTLDVWFDSGSSWYSALPMTDTHAPCDLVVEGSDQHRGWFQSSLITCAAMTGVAPFKTVVTHGFVLDENNVKMSKSKGNIISPREIIEGPKEVEATQKGQKQKGKQKGKPKASVGYGADVMRLWVCSTDFSKDVSLSFGAVEKISDGLRRVRNSSRFMLGCLADLPADALVPYEELDVLDKYMLDQVHSWCQETQAGYEDFSYARVFSTLVNANAMLSTLYFETSKDRLYADPVNSRSRRACQTVLFHVLWSLVRMSAPVTPFTSQDIFNHMPPQLKAMVKSQVTTAAGKPERWSPKRRVSVTSNTTEHQWEDFVFAHGWAAAPAQWSNANVRTEAAFLKDLRDVTNRAVEGARGERLASTAMEVDAFLVIQATGDNKNVQQKIMSALTPVNGPRPYYLADVLMVGRAVLQESAAPNPQWDAFTQSTVLRFGNVEVEVDVQVRPAKFAKCDRCWNWRVGDPDAKQSTSTSQKGLCGRCNDVVADLPAGQ